MKRESELDSEDLPVKKREPIDRKKRFFGEDVDKPPAKRQSFGPIQETNFASAQTEKRKWVMPGSLGVTIGKALLSGRPTVSDEEFKASLTLFQTANLTPKKVNITTSDGEHVNAVEFKQEPPTDKTIVVFQGQRGNIMTPDELRRLQTIAQKTGANVVSFNYRASPNSSRALINDAKAVTEYVFKQSKSNVTFYGDSLGGTVATVTAAELKQQSNNQDQVKLFAARAPKSLAYAIKNIDLTSLSSSKVSPLIIKITQSVKDVIPRKAYDTIMKSFGDLHSQAAINKLNPNNVECFRVENDKIVPQNATVSHDQKSLHVFNAPPYADPHNTSPEHLSQEGTDNKAIDLLAKLAEKPLLSNEFTDSEENAQTMSAR